MSAKKEKISFASHVIIYQLPNKSVNLRQGEIDSHLEIENANEGFFITDGVLLVHRLFEEKSVISLLDLLH